MTRPNQFPQSLQSPFAATPLFSSLRLLTLLSCALAAGWWTWHNVATVLQLAQMPSFLALPLKYQPDAPMLLLLLAIIVSSLSFFVLGYLLPALVDGVRLFLVCWDLRRAVRAGWPANPGSGSVERSWFYYPLFTRLWHEFAASLQCQRQPGHWPGEERLVYHATLAPESCFNSVLLVDVPMRVEFFRYLPGLLTGAGIIGTFVGILFGLSQFNPIADPSHITLQLEQLFTGVATAFVASFLAILTALAVTLLEKWLLHWRYAQVSFLHSFIGFLFRPISDLEQAVAASRQSNAHNEALVQQLSQLTTVLQEQWSQGITTMSTKLHEGVREALLEPLRVISQSVRLVVSQRQEEQEQWALLTSSVQRIVEQMTTPSHQSSHRDEMLAQRLHQAIISSQEPLREAIRSVAGQRQEEQERLATLIEVVQRIHGWLLARPDGGRQEVILTQLLEQLTAIGGGVHQATREMTAVVAALPDQGNRGLERLLQQMSTVVERVDAMAAVTQGLRGELVRQVDRFLLQQERSEAFGPQLVATVSEALARHQKQLEQGLNETMQTIQQQQALLWQNTTVLLQSLGLVPTEQLVHGVQSAVSDVSGDIRQQLQRVMDTLLLSLNSHLEHSSSRLADHLTAMRNLLVAEQETLHRDLKQWTQELSGSNQQNMQVAHQRMAEFLAWSQDRHGDLLTALEQFNQRVSADLVDKMQQVESEILQHRVEADQAMTGRIEQIVRHTGSEQAVFIEMLSERLDSLRQRLKIR
ncbi:MAG: hypothetical protein HQL60_02335 [Magnetococcales bacterium]|nr:hypothetical protein [Magnetococcales bacterium]